MQNIELYGGAVQTVVPLTFGDLSRFQQVPDNQEVYCCSDSSRSIMFELFSMHDSTPENAAVHYFKDLARVNGDYDPIDPKFNKLNSSCFPLFSTPNGESWVAYAAAGHQSAVKRKESKSNDVYVTLVLIRIPHCDTDFLISLNSTKIADDKSFDKPGHIFSESEDEAVMELIAKNLKFNDWSLVGA